MNRKISLGIVAGSVILVLLLAAGGISLANSELFRQFQDFKMTIINKSDHDILSVETGIYQSDGDEGKSKHHYTNVIASGKKKVIKPRLTIHGEGGIYMQFVDASGREARTSVCSYTESSSGYALVTITNDDIEVEGRCM